MTNVAPPLGGTVTALAVIIALMIMVTAALLRQRPAALRPALATAAGRPRATSRRDAPPARPTKGANGTGNGRTGNGPATSKTATGTGRNAKAKPAPSGGTTGTRDPGTRNGRQPSAPSARRADDPAVNPVSGTPRLGTGQLRAQVLAYLTEHRGQELSPNAIGKALGRSVGAVGNALRTLAKTGEALQTSDKPRRFTVPARGGKANGNDTNRTANGTRQSVKAPAARGTRRPNGGNGKATSPAPTSATVPTPPTGPTTKGRPAAKTATASKPNGRTGNGDTKPPTRGARATKRATR